MPAIILLGLLTAAVGPSTLPLPSAPASRIVGQVIDAETSEPVPGAIVRLRGTERAGITDRHGRFVFEVDRGSWYLEVEHVGYRPASDTIHVTRDDFTYTVTVRIATRAIPLDPITVRAAPNPGNMLTGVYDRMEQMKRIGLGSFVTREEIEERGGSSIMRYLISMPATRIRRYQIPDSLPNWREYVDVLTIVPQRIGEPPCPPLYYVNGTIMRIDWRSGEEIDQYVSSRDVEVIEVYRRQIDMPIEFGGFDAGCGVVAIWTRRGG